MTELTVRRILNKYRIDVAQSEIRPLGAAGGFSGAEFWKVEPGRQSYCLRKWPTASPTKSRLQKIHHVLKHAADRGIECLPVPLVHQGQSTIYVDQHHFWEVSRWLPGVADFWQSRHQLDGQAECLEKLRAAATMLARFHVAVVDVIPAENSISPAMPDRLDRLRSLRGTGLDRIRRAIGQNMDQRLNLFKADSLAEKLLEGFLQHAAGVETRLQAGCALRVPQQVCIKDIWHDHILFSGSEVTGIVDFGAMKIDSVAADISRLFGSLVEDDQQLWQIALQTYQQTRPLSQEELQLVKVFDQSGVLMSGMSWLEWLFVDQRKFENLLMIRQRLEKLVERIASLI